MMSHVLTARLIVPLLALTLAVLASPEAVAAQQRSAAVPQDRDEGKVNACKAAAQKAEEAERKAEAAAFRNQEDARIQKENAKLQARLAFIKPGRGAERRLARPDRGGVTAAQGPRDQGADRCRASAGPQASARVARATGARMSRHPACAGGASLWWWPPLRFPVRAPGRPLSSTSAGPRLRA